jgi:hypothetical protein
MQSTEELVKFDSAPEAFEWAEEILSKAAAGESQMARLLRRPGGGEFTFEELRDQALTISAIVARTEPPAAARTFQYVFGRDDNVVVQDLMDALVREVSQLTVGRHPQKTVALLHCVLQGYRRYIQKNRYQHAEELAQAMRMTRRGYYKGRWFEVTQAARKALERWQAQAEASIELALDDRGFLRGS